MCHSLINWTVCPSRHFDNIGKSLHYKKKQSLELAHLNSKTELDDEIIEVFLAVRKYKFWNLHNW